MKSIEKQIMINDLDELLNRFTLSLRSHSRRVAVCSAIIADHANLFIAAYSAPNSASLSVIAHLGGTCHDIGKLLLPFHEANRDEYLKHPDIGADLLERYKNELLGDDPSTQTVIDIVRYHHERWDGSGFPGGLKTRDIPLYAGICQAADTLDHFMDPGGSSGGDDLKVFEMLRKQAGISFSEFIWDCIEGAWPYLIEKYAAWNNKALNN